jgi:predicted ATPase
MAQVRAALGDGMAELAQIFPSLADGQGSRLEDAGRGRLRLFEALLALIQLAARDGLLLVVEDLQWADASTRELLDYLARRLRHARVMLLGTYRSDELHRRHPLQAAVQTWRRAGLAELVELSPLTPDQVSQMVEAIFEIGEVSTDFRDYLHQRAEGNPFVLEEMLKEALDHGDIYGTG